ncbi:MAG TPA: efflux RND transporter periplasmic adaptor subunit, partial [Cyclobacteriaceae bacterium]|nr:efflux RND transporter periplasmic adaptor subunit [Cyclobacteriaceae bacterium]
PLQEIRKGDPLYSIYSEQLLTDEKSLLLVLAQKENKSVSSVDMDNMVRAAEKKLTLWGLSETQIDKLKTTKQTSALVDFFSPSDGVVTDVSVREGEYVQTGTSIVKITDLHSVWVDVQLYVNEVNFLEQHPAVDIRFDSYPDKVFAARVAFINPVVESQRKINLARFEVINQGNLLKPGLMAYVRVKHDEHKALVIPRSSIILEKDVASVWIQTGNGMYEKRMIKTGISDGMRLEVLSGLEKNDVVVSSGAYLLNSEFVLKNGANSMGGMKM